MAVEIDNRIKELCQEQGITPYGLAKRIGRRPNTITRIINKERFGSDDLIADICRGLEKDVGDVFFLPLKIPQK